MDSDELKKACERAGAECFGEFCILHPGTRDEWHAAYIHPALPSYVADLLLRMGASPCVRSRAEGMPEV